MDKSASYSDAESVDDQAGGTVSLRARLASGAIDAEKVVSMCLEQIAAREADVQAWAWLDSDHALNQARKLDAKRRSGASTGALHGLPVALKDIIDTAGIPTCNGTVLDEGRVPVDDSFIAEQLKREGAIILGKTVTTELAFMEPGKTRHPLNAKRSPGGSSSGSAAAVACGMVPLAVGTQTAGSVIRPAAYCGITGFKPSFGKIPRTGVLKQSPSLDTVGVFGRTVTDVALLAEVLYGHDRQDQASTVSPHPRLLSVAQIEPPMTPLFAFVKTSSWSEADPAMQMALQELVDALGEQCFEAELPALFADALPVRTRINLAEMAKNFHGYASRDTNRLLSENVMQGITTGSQVLARDYLAALDWPDILNAGLDEVFERCDAIITPATTGPAPDISGTGSPVFNSLWTLCGTPAVTLPLFSAEDGMPMGVQLVGRRDDDARLLRTARWLEGHVASLSEQ